MCVFLLIIIDKAGCTLVADRGKINAIMEK
jgi:hypothetical protein